VSRDLRHVAEVSAPRLGRQKGVDGAPNLGITGTGGERLPKALHGRLGRPDQLRVLGKARKLQHPTKAVHEVALVETQARRGVGEELRQLRAGLDHFAGRAGGGGLRDRLGHRGAPGNQAETGDGDDPPAHGRSLPTRYPLARFLLIAELPADKWAAVLAERVGVDRRTCHRWARDGVPLASADRLALTWGLHPANVWPEWLEVAA